jgi:hypothetical protein
MPSDTAVTEIEKRVVIYVVTGRRAGMRRIIGHMIFRVGDELPKQFQNVFICEGEPGRNVFLVGEYPRYIMYREIPVDLTPPRKRRAKMVLADGNATSIESVEVPEEAS